jgi:capsular exopolysaccharide synthesis family protein
VTTQADERDLDVQETSTASTSLGLLQVGWQRKSLVILGLVLGLVAGTLFYAQKQPIYQSSSKILVVKKTPDNTISSGPDGRSTFMEDYLATHAELIRSSEIVGRAARSPELKDLQSFPDQGDLTYQIVNGLAVSRGRDPTGGVNNILVLAFKGPVAEECPKILDAVVVKYQEFLNETYKDVSDRTLDLIKEARNTLKGELDQAEKAYLEFRQRSPAGLMRIGNGLNVYSERLAMIERRRSEIDLKHLELTTRLGSIERAFKDYGKAAALRAIQANRKEALITGDKSLDDALLPLMLERKKLQSAGLGPNHPQIKLVDDAIEFTRELYHGRVGDRVAAPAPGEERPRDPDTVEVYLQQLRADIADNIAMLQDLDTKFIKARGEAQELNNYEALEDQLKSNVTTNKELFNTIVKRLQEISLVRGHGGYTAQPVERPGLGRKVAPNPYLVFSLASVLGLVVGTGLAYLAEVSDKSFRTPAEIRRRLGLPVIGHIPFIGPDEKAKELVAAGTATLDPMLCTHYSSNSVEAEAYRGVRTALYFNTRGAGHQVIQVTSPNASDGKSTLAANMAVSIAQSGKRTVLIDCDFRKPRVHKIFNVPGTVGMASVIAGQATLESAVQQSAVPNLSILPCGPRPANPAELLTSPRFKEVLDAIRTHYDFVLVDTPPLLVVTDPSVVAPRVDGVVMCIRVTKNGRPYAERAKEILGALGANVLGVVVNGFGTQADGSRYGYEHYSAGYGGYGYGHGYGYGYGYGYTYGDASYYADPVEEPAPAANANGNASQANGAPKA